MSKESSKDEIYILKSTKIIYYFQILTGTSRVVVNKDKVYPRPIYWFLLTIILSMYMGYKSITYNLNNATLQKVLTLMSFIGLYYFVTINMIVTRKLACRLYNMCIELDRYTKGISIAMSKFKGIDYLDLILITGLGLNVSFVIDYYMESVIIIPTELWLVLFYNRCVLSIIQDFDLLLWLKISKYLRMKLQELNRWLKNKYCSKRPASDRIFFVKEKEIKSEHTEIEKYVHIIEKIVYSHNILKELYKSSILFFNISFFLWFILRVYELLLVIHMNTSLWKSINGLLTKDLKNFVMIIALSVSAEKFSSELDNTRNLCLEILDDYDVKSKQHQSATKMIWLIEEMPSNYNFFGLFELDGKLPFRITALFSTYIIILIQFVFM